MKSQTAERRLFKPALAARRAGLAPQSPARCKGEKAGLFADFGCIGLSVPRTRDARRAVLAFSLGEWGKRRKHLADEADKGMLHSLCDILIRLTNRKRLPFATFPFLGKAQNNTPEC